MPLTAALAGDLSLFVDAIWSAGTALTEGARRQLARQDADVAVAVGEDAIALAAPAWQRIEADGGAATPFQSLAVARRAAGVHLRRGETPYIVVVHEAGHPAAILPGVLVRRNAIATLRFLGDPLIQYGDAVAAPGTAPELLEAAWRTAVRSSGASLIHFRKVRADARIAPVLARHAQTISRHEAPFLDLQRPQPAASGYGRELRRYRRRLAEAGEVRFETLHGPAAALAANEALRIKREWIAMRGLPSNVIGDPDWEQAIVALASEADSTTGLHAARLSVGGRTAAVEIGFLHGGRWYAFLGALAPDFAKAGPGHVQMAETVDFCRQSGLAAYDLLAPSDAYKRLIANGAVAVRDHAMAVGGSGWLGLLAERAMPAAKRILSRVPPRLRNVLIGRRPRATA